MSASPFMDNLKARVMAHPFLKHSFLQRFVAKPLTREQAQRFALLYYPHILRTRLYQACALGVTPDEQIQFVLAQILHDEYGNGDPNRSHMAVYRKCLYALEIPQTQIDHPPIIPEVQSYIDTMMRLSQGSDWLAAVAAVGIAGEWPIPPYYEILLRGLRTVPNITEDDLELFSSHITLDIEHSKMTEDALLPYVQTEAGQAAIWRGIELNLNARLVKLNGLQREVFDA